MATVNEPKLKYWGEWPAPNKKTYRVYTIRSMRVTAAWLLEKGGDNPLLCRMDGEAVCNPHDKPDEMIGLRVAVRRAIQAYVWLQLIAYTKEDDSGSLTALEKSLWSSFRLWLREKRDKGFLNRVSAHIVAQKMRLSKMKKENAKK